MMLRMPETYSQYRRYRRRWSRLFLSASLLLVVMGVLLRTEMLLYSWDSELLRILPAAILALLLAHSKGNDWFYSALITGKWLWPACLIGGLLLLCDFCLSMHTATQTVAQLSLVIAFFFSFKSIMQADASLFFSIPLILASPLLVHGSVVGALLCLLPGVFLCRTVVRSTRVEDPARRLSLRPLISGLVLFLISILVAIHLHSPSDNVTPVSMMHAARAMLYFSRPLGISRYAGFYALDGFPIDWDYTGYFAAVTAHRLGWASMVILLAPAVLWLISGTFLCLSPVLSRKGTIMHFVCVCAWICLAVPMALFILQNLGLVPYLAVEAPFLSRNIVSQLVTIFLTFAILQTDSPEIDYDPKGPKPDRDTSYTITIVGERSHDRLAA